MDHLKRFAAELFGTFLLCAIAMLAMAGTSQGDAGRLVAAAAYGLGVIAGQQSKARLEQVVQSPVVGFRAPCFSMDRVRLEEVRKAGYVYDSSRIDFTGHPLYGSLNVDDFDAVSPGHFVQEGFHEFEVSTLPVLGKRLPVSGGGYLRIAPWAIMRPLIASYAKECPLYVLYIHPFELSKQPNPTAAAGLPWPQRLRFGLGRSGVAGKLEQLVQLLKNSGFEFVPFRDLCQHSAVHT